MSGPAFEDPEEISYCIVPTPQSDATVKAARSTHGFEDDRADRGCFVTKGTTPKKRISSCTNLSWAKCNGGSRNPPLASVIHQSSQPLRCDKSHLTFANTSFEQYGCELFGRDSSYRLKLLRAFVLWRFFTAGFEIASHVLLSFRRFKQLSSSNGGAGGSDR